MKRNSFVIAVVLCTALASCASIGVSVKGKDYFTGKSEEDIAEYFGYAGEILPPEAGYDKVVFFTNRVTQYQMKKTTVRSVKVSKSETLFTFSFSERNDGCLVYANASHYTETPPQKAEAPGEETESPAPAETPPPRHRNDNSLVRADLARFNNEVARTGAVSADHEETAFAQAPVGSRFFVYSVEQTASSSVYTDRRVPVYPEESFAVYTHTLREISVTAEDRTETETELAGRYEERSRQYFARSGGAILKTELDTIIGIYTSQGFRLETAQSGLSAKAYIQNGKIVMVE